MEREEKAPEGAQQGLTAARAGKILAAITLAAALLRFRGLGAQSFWLDEAASWFFARLPARDLLAHNMDHGNPPLYYVLLGGWMRLFGDSEAALRSLSAVAGVLAVPAIYLLGKLAHGRRVGLVAAALLAFSPIHVYYSQEARQYALVLLLGLVSVLFFVHAQHSDRWGAWVGTVLFAALAFYVHYTGALIPVFEWVWAFFYCRTGRALRAAALLVALCLPGVLLYFAPSFGPASGKDDWSAGQVIPSAAQGYAYWQGYFTPGSFIKLANSLYGKPAGPDSPAPIKALVALLLAVAIGLPLGVALGQAARPRPDFSHHRAQFALLYLLTPVILFAAAACVRPMWQDRYVLVALPGYLLIVAWMLASMPRMRLVLGGSVVALSAAGFLAGGAFTHPKADWRGAVAAMRAATAPVGDSGAAMLVTKPFMRVPVDYYWRGGPERTGFPLTNEPLGARDEAAIRGFARAADGKSGVFVVYGGAGDGDPDLRMARSFAARWQPARVRVFDGVRVFAFGSVATGFGGVPVSPATFSALAHLDRQ